MNRLLTTLLFMSFLCTCVSAQNTFNTALRDQLTYTPALNDVWGYVAPDGTEYALVGTRDGVSVVSLADPDNIVEVASLPGDFSVWRDIKTYGEFAYVVLDQGTSDDGIVVIDLSDLPAGASQVNYDNIATPLGPVKRAHNIYIDEPTGLAFVAGSRLNGGGMMIYDVATTPGVPAFVAAAPSVYAHDVYVRGDRMYSSQINAGTMGIYDISDLQNITLLGEIATPFAFTHNIWISDDGFTAYTTDERGNAPTAAYDVTDPLDIMLIDEFRPRRSINTGVVPHNVHVQDDYLIISHYSDGVEIVDASVPDNLVEVAYFDPPGGGSGSWGAYPFLPSGLVLDSDISNGLYVFDAVYQRAARLRGEVTDRDTGLPLNNVVITFADSDGLETGTNALGDYKTGLAMAGTYLVTFSLAGYEDLTVPVEMLNGVNRVLDTFLVQAALPVRWAGFTAEALGKSAARLSWGTVSESGSDYFLVERSLSGHDFERVGRVAAGGESVLTRNYEFTDNGLEADTYFYRLRQVDQDGSSAFSEVRRVVLETAEDLYVYPNPVGERLMLSDEVNGTVRIYRNDGAVVLETKAAGREINVRDLPVGQYWLRAGNAVVPFVKR